MSRRLVETKDEAIKARKESIQRIGHELGSPVSDAKAEKIARERTERACERAARQGKR